MKKLLILVFLCLLTFSSAFTQSPLNGTWEGAITIQGQELGILFNFEGEPQNYSGTLDIPQQGASDLPLLYVVVDRDSVSIGFNTGTGMGEFEGVRTDQNKIKGTYSQSGASFSFQVQKRLMAEDATDVFGQGEEVLIPNGEWVIGGTLVLPEGVNEPPIVILLSGSGAQNRDSEIFGFQPFAEIAGHLNTQGIASFRYDDRGIGVSTGDLANATLSDLATDVDQIITFLQDSIDTDFGEIILLGHSQGGIIAGNVARSNSNVDQLILMASPGEPLMNILRFQVEQAYRQLELPQNLIQDEIDAREDLMMALSDENDLAMAIELYQNAYRELLLALPEDQLQAVTDNIDNFIQRQTEQLISIYSSSQMISLLFYDPTTDLSELSIPVLVLLGGKDSQLPIDVNEEQIRSALRAAGTEFEILTFQDANHLFQEAETGLVTEYSSLEKEFIDGFLTTLSDWIENHE